MILLGDNLPLGMDYVLVYGTSGVDDLRFVSLQNGSFATPRRGKNNDQAHPPIHPTAYAGNLAGDDKRVYEFVTRRFLAACSKDALGFETTVEVAYGEEEFSATGRPWMRFRHVLCSRMPCRADRIGTQLSRRLPLR